MPSHPPAQPQRRSETNLGPNEGPLDNEMFRVYANHVVHGPGIEVPYLVGAIVRTQPLEALEWIMEGMSHFREDPAERSRQCNLYYLEGNSTKHSSPAMAWVTHPERLAVALERKWLVSSCVKENRDPEFLATLGALLKDPAMLPVLGCISEALERNYGQEFKAYKRLVLAQRLEAIPAPVALKAKPRF